MKIPLSSPDITDLEINSVISVLKTPNLSLGPKLLEFEQKLAEYAGAEHCVAVNSGTSALHLIIRSLGIGKNAEVITTPFSFVASANCLLYEQAKPVFVDIEPRTYNIDVKKIESKITGRTKAILAVDIFGYPADWAGLKKLAQRHKLHLIEDSCEALGAQYKGKKAGVLGEAGCFAFYPNKQITTGEGGVIITNNDRIAAECKSLRNQGRDECSDWSKHQRLGYNYRLSDINCALGIAQLARIEEILSKREQIAKIYREKLQGIEEIVIPQDSNDDIIRSWFVYVIRLRNDYSRKDRDHIIAELRGKGIGCSDYFNPIHLQPFYLKSFKYKKGDFPVAESVADRTIALPFFNNLRSDQVDQVTNNLKALLLSVNKRKD